MPTATPRRSSHRTQWAAQFAVASELCKRGYEVAFTMGNHPSVDLMVTSPQGIPFFIDVKGLYKKNFWAVRRKIQRGLLFYALVFVPDGDQNRFFLLSQEEVNEEVEAEIDRAVSRAQEKGRDVEKAYAFEGLGWRFAERAENAWHVLPA